MNTVLFVCPHGAAKSVVAAQLFESRAREAGLPLVAVARGTEPDEEIAPAAAAGLRAEGIDVGGQTPRRLSREDIAEARLVVSLGADIAEVGLPQVRVERWDDVPAVSDGYEAAREVIDGHLRELIVDLSRPDL